MTVVVTVERRFVRTPDGCVWTPSTAAYGFWQRYLDVFDQVRVVGRVREVSQVDPTWKRADGPGVSFAAVPFFLGPAQYLRRRPQVRRAARDAIRLEDAAILRVPGTLATCLEGVVWRQGKPIAVEVIADPYEVFAAGNVRTPFRPFFRWWFRRGVRRQCARARAAAYVTARTLQRRYPAGADAYVTSYSSIDLTSEAFVPKPRPVKTASKRFNLLLIGSLEQLYKAPDVLIKAVTAAVQRGLDLRLTIVGDGKHRPELEALALACGMEQRVRFTGNLPAGDPVRAELDRADLFVLPSRTEGLPRALLEAMARGLPCLGSEVGGIVELLSLPELVKPADVQALAAKMKEVLTDPDRLARLSAYNLEKAREFHSDILRPRRRAFYEAVRDATLNWQRREDTVLIG